MHRRYEADILEREQSEYGEICHVAFVGWGPEYNEAIFGQSGRIMPLHTFTKPDGTSVGPLKSGTGVTCGGSVGGSGGDDVSGLFCSDTGYKLRLRVQPMLASPNNLVGLLFLPDSGDVYRVRSIRRDGNELAFEARSTNAVALETFDLVLTVGDHGLEGTCNQVRVRFRPAEASRKTLLYVLETYWERTLDRPDYSFGEILQSLCRRFARTVDFRHRRITSVTDFRRFALLAAFVAEPVVIVLSSHGGPCGPWMEYSAVVENEPARTRSEARREATLSLHEVGSICAECPNVELLHFDCCSVLLPTETANTLQARLELPKAHQIVVSGFTVTADWHESATLEFYYIGLIMKGETPLAAAKKAAESLAFADSRLGFRYFELGTGCRDGGSGAVEISVAGERRWLPVEALSLDTPIDRLSLCDGMSIIAPHPQFSADRLWGGTISIVSTEASQMIAFDDGDVAPVDISQLRVHRPVDDSTPIGTALLCVQRTYKHGGRGGFREWRAAVLLKSNLLEDRHQPPAVVVSEDYAGLCSNPRAGRQCPDS